MRAFTVTPQLFAAAGVIFALASLIVPRDAAHALDFWIGDTPHAVHLYWIAAAICWFWSAVYYALERLLHLHPRLALSLLHFAITLALLIGLSAKHYVGLAANPDFSPSAWLAIVFVPHAAAFTALTVGVFVLSVAWSLLGRA